MSQLRYAVVMPAHNESAFIKTTLESLASQSVAPQKVVVVDDHSTDDTGLIARNFATKYAWLSVVDNESDAVHLPGSKVIRAFNKGFETLTVDYDIIVKLDADLILPPRLF